MSKQMETYALLSWYDANKRDLPWRVDRDPYRVWVSEIMLQQTRVEAVRGYFFAFTQRFPSVEALASAQLEQVYKAWEGLGYYSRARRLHEAAAEIVRRGGFPPNYARWLELPGIGAYTAGAIASICYGEAVLAVDGNVLRVMARYAGIREPIQAPSSKRIAQEEAGRLLDASRPGDFNQALMELGAMVCTPRSPRCGSCPWNHTCNALAAGDADGLPVKTPKKAKATERLNIAVIVCGCRVLLRKRPEGGLLGGQWEFPYDLAPGEFQGLEVAASGEIPPCRFVFTHRIWEMSGGIYRAKKPVLPGEAYRWVTKDALLSLPVPTAMAVFRRAALEALE